MYLIYLNIVSEHECTLFYETMKQKDKLETHSPLRVKENSCYFSLYKSLSVYSMCFYDFKISSNSDCGHTF